MRAANKNFMRSSLLGRLLNKTRQREVPTSPTIPFYVIGSSQNEIGHKVGDRQPECVGAHGRVRHSKKPNRTTAGQLAGTAVLWAATAVHLRFRRISVAVKSIFGAIGLPWNDPLCADAPINTAAFPYLYTSVSSSVIESSLSRPI